jgi:hypothetical protein
MFGLLVDLAGCMVEDFLVEWLVAGLSRPFTTKVSGDNKFG